MITLIHGDDLVRSRETLTSRIAAYPDFEVIRLDGRSVDTESLAVVGGSASLFQEKKLVVIESLLTNLRAKARIELVHMLTHPAWIHDVILWEGKQLEKSIITKHVPGAREYLCALPKILFDFLGAIGSVPAQKTVETFHHVVKQQDPGLVFSLLLRQWRHLILVKELGIAGVPPELKWQARSYAQQAHHFTLEALIQSYRDLLSIDVKMKTGQTPFSITELLDIFFLHR